MANPLTCNFFPSHTQDQSRAILTGALAGAQSGFSGIPRRFINGLENSEYLCELAWKLADSINEGNSVQGT